MIYYLYTLTPCDDWSPFLTVEAYLHQAENPMDRNGRRKWVNKMRQIAEHCVCWEGEPHTECVGALPGADFDPVRFYCAKQSNNGTTFVVSPVPIWHLVKPTGEYDTPADLVLLEWVEKSKIYD